MARDGGLDVELDIDAAKGTEEFREARRQVDDKVREGLRRAGEDVALPEAKRRAPKTSSRRGALMPGQLRQSLVVRPRARDAYLTTNLRAKKARIVGLHEFGGTVRDPIRPKRGPKRGRPRALRMPDGGFVPLVTSPRRYRGQHFLEGAVQAKRGEIDEAVLDNVMDAFDGLPHT